MISLRVCRTDEVPWNSLRGRPLRELMPLRICRIVLVPFNLLNPPLRDNLEQLILDTMEDRSTRLDILVGDSSRPRPSQD